MIKRFNPDFSLSISHELAYMRETPEGGYVAHGDYATLFSELEGVKAERDRLQQINYQTLQVKLGMAETIKEQSEEVNALAVENAALSAALSLISGCYGLSPHIQSMCVVDCQATDAALAAIEARGVEKAVNALDALSELSASATSQANFRASAVYLRTEVLPGIGEAK
jgi:hypothetical protein